MTHYSGCRVAAAKTEKITRTWTWTRQKNLDLVFAYRRLLGGSFTIICCTLQRTRRWWADYDLRGRYNLRQDDHVRERTRAHARVVEQLLVPLPLIVFR